MYALDNTSHARRYRVSATFLLVLRSSRWQLLSSRSGRLNITANTKERNQWSCRELATTCISACFCPHGLLMLMPHCAFSRRQQGADVPTRHLARNRDEISRTRPYSRVVGHYTTWIWICVSESRGQKSCWYAAGAG